MSGVYAGSGGRMVEEVISTDPRADRTVLFLQEISNIILKLVQKINLQK